MNREDVKCSKCGCRRFWRRRTKEVLVDFGRPSSSGSSPMFEGSEGYFQPAAWQCAECGAAPGDMTQHEMSRLGGYQN